MMVIAGVDIGVRYVYCAFREKGRLRFLRLNHSEFYKFADSIVKDGGVISIDGPQGLSSSPERARIADSVLNTPVKCGYDFPPSSNPYSSFVRVSVELFYVLYRNGFKLLTASGTENASVIETYPGEVWRVLGVNRSKRMKEGLNERKRILRRFIGSDVELPSDHNFLDALACMLTSQFYVERRYMCVGAELFEDKEKRVLREGWLVLPFLP